ncbi:hypothetical protein C2845_PM01G16770 [Panicum miliaceum]|uniref:Uncharacterized protein n=1 Tax=Panicum miliaceum TaxID=4540 RepID=A0A3L6TVD6_PANMI|nr:hypothetical protein C2845_PM01G16770 [Panicum miliaceum]
MSAVSASNLKTRSSKARQALGVHGASCFSDRRSSPAADRLSCRGLQRRVACRSSLLLVACLADAAKEGLW